MNENSEYLAPLEARWDCGMCGADNADSRTDCRVCAKPKGYKWTPPEPRIVAERLDADVPWCCICGMERSTGRCQHGV